MRNLFPNMTLPRISIVFLLIAAFIAVVPASFTYATEDPDQCEIILVSDIINQVTGGGNAVATYSENSRWTASIPGATWIWKTFLVPDPLNEENQSFYKSFNLAVTSTSTIVSASLTVAADNSYSVYVNSTKVGEDQTEFNYFDEDKEVFNVLSNLVDGSNTISFDVKNWASSSTPQDNPAGLLYKLDIVATGANCATTTATTTVTVNENNGGGGGGGGGGGSSSGGSVLSVSTSSECFYLHNYMRRDFNNDPIEVLKLQAFLINFEGHSNVALTGVFDQTTFDAVSAFQMKYSSDILEPWSHTGPTGYVYILTLKKINEIYCQRIFPLNQAQLNEIVAFRALLESLRAQGIIPQLPGSGGSDDPSLLLPIVGSATSSQGQNFGNLNNLAAVLFTRPGNLSDMMKYVLGFVLILAALYILGNVLKGLIYEDVPENVRKRFIVKWSVINAGLVSAIIVSYMSGQWSLVSPLLVALVVTILWTLSSPSKHNSIRASVKSWFLVGSAWMKSAPAKKTAKETKVLPKEPDTYTFVLPKLSKEPPKEPPVAPIILGPKQ